MSDLFMNYRQWLEEQTMPKGKKAVLRSALTLFAQKGYDGTATIEIAKAAAVSQATVFKYFKTKQELLIAILQPMINNLLPVQRDSFFAAASQIDSLTDIIHFIVYNRYQFLKENADAVKILLPELVINEQVRQLLFDPLEFSKSVFTVEVIEKIQTSNELRPELDFAAVARTLISQVIAYFFQRQFMPWIPADEAQDLKLIEAQIIRAIKA